MHLFYQIRAAITHPLWRAYARLRRATVNPSVIFNGRPLIRCARGARLIIAEGVKINTSVASNPVIGRSRSCFSVIGNNAELIIGRDVGASGVSITAASSVVIGDGTLLGADCLITDTDFHAPEPGFRWSNDAAGTARPIRIGKGCFIGARAIVLKGVTLGDGAVIGAGAVVSRDVPENCLAVGNPAVIRPLPEKWRHPLA